MQIDNIILNADLLDIMTELKRQLSIVGVDKFAKMFYSSEDLMVCCPYHKDGQEHRPSAGIRKSDGMFHCLACGETHSLPEVISYCLGYYNDSFGREGIKWLAKNFASAEIQEREEISVDIRRSRSVDFHSAIRDNNSNNIYNKWDSNITNEDAVPHITEEELDKYRYTHPYMYKRGLNDTVIDLFDVGYDAVHSSITFPVKDRSGNCLFIARRSINNKRFDLPKGIEKPLYGLYETFVANKQFEKAQSSRQTLLPEVYVCEGLFDCLRLWCNGKVAVAGFGCLFNALQIEQLKSLPTRKLILALDNDDAGKDGARRILHSVTNKIVYRAVIPEGKKDIGELSDEEINNLEIKIMR